VVCIHLACGILCPYVVTVDQADPSESSKNSGEGDINSKWRKEQLCCGEGIPNLVVV